MGCIRDLRKVLSDAVDTPRYIQTVHRRGYRFIAAISAATVFSSKFLVPSQDQEPTNPPQRETRNQKLETRLVGREAKLTQLYQQLDKAQAGERQIVFVTGEPGIGKTALLDVFVSGIPGPASQEENQEAKGKKQKSENPNPQPQIQNPGCWVAVGQCIEQHGAGEPFLPILSALGELGRGADCERLVSVLRQYAPTWLLQLPSLITSEERTTLQVQAIGVTRERMLREIAEALETLTAERLLVVMLEDLHWCDASTLDLLALLARRKAAAKLLVLGTYRPVEMLNDGHPLKSITQELYAHQLATELPLEVLSETDVAAYLAERFQVSLPFQEEGQDEGGKPRFPLPLVHTLHQRTGGNPLFLVSLVNDLIDRGRLVQTAAGWELANASPVLAHEVPDSIRHLVARQSEHLLPEEQRTLEAASVVGMEFSAAAVAAALATDTAIVERQCEQLARRQQFLRRLGVEQWPDGTLAARYSFLHALYQQLWHERVTPTQLQHHHLQIGERKERAFGERAREIATELAVHFEQGRNYRKAVQYLGQAGQQALHRSASQEAIAHLTAGLSLLEQLPVTPERNLHELPLQVTLGVALMAIKGYAAPEVEAAYARARQLCQQLEDTPQLFPLLHGLLFFYSMRGELQTALEVNRQFQALAQYLQDPNTLVGAYYTSGLLSFLCGEFAAAQTSWEQCLAFYEPQQVPVHLLLYGYDPSVTAMTLSAFVRWLHGYPEQAVRKAQVALTQAQVLAHFHTLALTQFWSAHLYQIRREWQTAQAHAEIVLSLTQKQGSLAGLAHGKIIQGWALVEEGQRQSGISRILEGLTESRALGIRGGHPFFLALLAEAKGKAGQTEDGLVALTEALVQVDTTGERYYEAELYRLKGELTLQQESKEQRARSKEQKEKSILNLQGEAEACFRKAIEIAQKQQAKSWELRATTSLARLWHSQGKRHEAHRMLSEVYNWFTEGFDTKDLQEAKALIEELA